MTKASNRNEFAELFIIPKDIVNRRAEWSAVYTQRELDKMMDWYEAKMEEAYKELVGEENPQHTRFWESTKFEGYNQKRQEIKDLTNGMGFEI